MEAHEELEHFRRRQGSRNGTKRTAVVARPKDDDDTDEGDDVTEQNGDKREKKGLPK